MLIPLLLLVSLFAKLSTATNPCVVQLNSNSTGNGILNETFTGTSHCVYLGVRYALPPTGVRRFRSPELYNPSGVQNYTAFGSICPQWDDMNNPGKLIGDEDCLFMDIYVPATIRDHSDGTTGYPVLVYVHGGTFVVGSGQTFATHGVDLLMDNGVMVVAINYRLSVLGFLRIPQWNVTGNFGLQDQRAALQWIQRNIAAFGGDPERVTLMGHSAGASAAAHHLYSAGSRGLFQRLILMGGSNLGSYGLMYAQESNVTEKIMSAFNVSSLAQLQQINFTEFYSKYIFLSVPFMNNFTPYFVPAVEEGGYADTEPFIDESPHELVKRKPASRVPILMGQTATEFGKITYYTEEFFLGRNFPELHGDRKLIEARIYKLVAQRLRNATFSADVSRLTNMANIYYPIKRLLRHLVDFQGDDDWPVFYYRFEFDGRFGYCKYEYSKELVRERFYGAIHGDDLAYVFSPYVAREALANRSEYRKEWKVHERMVEMVVNFVKFGNPTPEGKRSLTWPAYNSNTSKPMYLNIDEELEVRMENDEQDEYYQFWEPIYQCLYYNECDTLKVMANNVPDGDYPFERFQYVY